MKNQTGAGGASRLKLEAACQAKQALDLRSPDFTGLIKNAAAELGSIHVSHGQGHVLPRSVTFGSTGHAKGSSSARSARQERHCLGH